MTVFADYAPVQYVPREDGRYRFPWEAAGSEVIELYEIDVVGNARQVKPQDYDVLFYDGDARVGGGLTREEGEARMTRPVTPGTALVSVERNTLITQTVDFPTANQNRFKSRIIEFMLDKCTMIAQELRQRKCISAPSLPITQEITFYAYGTYDDVLINAAVQKLVTILEELKANAEDCRSTPELT